MIAVAQKNCVTNKRLMEIKLVETKIEEKTIATCKKYRNFRHTDIDKIIMKIIKTMNGMENKNMLVIRRKESM